MLTIGCHLSKHRGYAEMAREAASIHANTFQYFTRSPRGSKQADLDAKAPAIIGHGYSLREFIHTQHRKVAPAVYVYCIFAVDNHGHAYTGVLPTYIIGQSCLKVSILLCLRHRCRGQKHQNCNNYFSHSIFFFANLQNYFNLDASPDDFSKPAETDTESGCRLHLATPTFV
jgi:hypothetical protein